MRSHDRNYWLEVLHFVEEEYWRELGYSCASKCLAVELRKGIRRAQQILEVVGVFAVTKSVSSAKIAEEIQEKTLRAMLKLPTDEMRREIWAEAVEDGDVSVTHMRALVDARIKEEDGQDDDSNLRSPGPNTSEHQVRRHPTSGTDWPARIARQVESARRLHRRLGDRRSAADAALDHYLQVIHGEG